MARQYVAVEFRRGGQTYTYHHDGEAIVPGDEVKVAARSGDGWSRVRVVEVDWIKPGFETKPILGRVEEEPDKPEGELPLDKPAPAGKVRDKALDDYVEDTRSGLAGPNLFDWEE